MRKILIFDTDILCVYFQIPKMEECGPNDNKWTKEHIDNFIAKEEENKTTFVLPLAAIIETGNHITQSSGDRYLIAQKFVELLNKVADAQEPWAAFTEQAEFWEPETLRQLANEWLSKMPQKLSMGDVSIKAIAEYYAKSGWQVEILTGDQGLKAYEPPVPPPIPRRRK